MNGKCISIPKNFGTDEVNEFRKNLNDLIKKGERNFIIDFSECAFIDVTGLGVLISINNRCTKLNGSFKLSGINPSIIEIFKLTRLDKILERN